MPTLNGLGIKGFLLWAGPRSAGGEDPGNGGAAGKL